MEIKQHNGINYVNIEPSNLIVGETILHSDYVVKVLDVQWDRIWAKITVTDGVDEWIIDELWNCPFIHLVVKDEQALMDRKNRIDAAYESLNY